MGWFSGGVVFCTYIRMYAECTCIIIKVKTIKIEFSSSRECESW